VHAHIRIPITRASSHSYLLALVSTRFHKYNQTYKVIVSIGVTEPREHKFDGLEDQIHTSGSPRDLSGGGSLQKRLKDLKGK
jgi:hypothetical protein